MEDTSNKRREAMIDKITGLMNMAEDKGATPEEAEAFYAKAQALMSKWAIDEELLKMAGHKSTDVIKTVKIKVPSTYFAALIFLWDNVGRANDCVTLQQKWGGGQPQVVLTGYESDITTVQILVTSLTLFATREAQRDSKAQGGDYYFRRSFIESFAHRIGARLEEQRKLTLKEVKEETGSDLLPALIDKHESVQKYMNEHLRPGKARGGSRKQDYAGKAAGRAAADRADIGNKQVGSRRALPR